MCVYQRTDSSEDPSKGRTRITSSSSSLLNPVVQDFAGCSDHFSTMNRSHLCCQKTASLLQAEMPYSSFLLQHKSPFHIRMSSLASATSFKYKYSSTSVEIVLVFHKILKRHTDGALFKKWGESASTLNHSCSPSVLLYTTVHCNCALSSATNLSKTTLRETPVLHKVSLRQDKNHHPEHSMLKKCLWEKGNISFL